MRVSRTIITYLFTAAAIAGITSSASQAQQRIEDRITSIMNAMTTAEKIKQLHQEGSFNTADNTRLGVPGFVMADGPHGVRDGLATSFPVGIAMAATWDRSMVLRIGAGMGIEFRAKGKDQALGPCMDLDRDPRNGRSPESGGEDPYLCAQITSAVTRGIQSSGALATIKHYNANHREQNRYYNNVTISRRWLHEHYGLAFRTSVQEGGAFSVMNAYNLINSQKCAENSLLLSTILKNEWGFPFYVVSDWDSIFDSERAINAGCDICMGSDKYKNDLPSLVSSGKVSMEVIDRAVRRVLRTKILSGVIDRLPSTDPSAVNSESNQKICLEGGRRAIVLLKNDGNILPLDPASTRSVALIGPSAAFMQIDGSGSGYVTPFYSVSPRTGLEKKFGAGKISYLKGCDINSQDTSAFPEAVALAKASDVVIFCGGLDGSQEGEGFDRAGGSTALPGRQQDLINALARENKKIIVVLFSGGVCSTTRSINNIAALLYAFYPSQEGGNAVADVLTGEYNPGGRLPVTIPQSDSQLPPWTGNDNFNNDWGCGYRWFDKTGRTPQFAFGFGLSYTTFAYANLRVTPLSSAPGEPVTVSVDVTNTGSRRGDEVAQCYLTHDQATVPMPVKELKGFERVTLEPGETKTVTFTLTADELYYYDEANTRFDIEAGRYTVRVGGSSDKLPLSAAFTVTDASKKPDLLVTKLITVPAYPKQGEKVTLAALVKNRGVGAVATGTHLKTRFSVNGVEICTADTVLADGIPAGGMALIYGEPPSASSSAAWQYTAAETGPIALEARVDPENAVGECVESNNLLASQTTVLPKPPVNLALNKTVTVSSVEASGLEGWKAVDGSLGTRWSSAFSDPQSIMIDLGASTYLTDMLIVWEAAYAKEYQVQLSTNSLVWQTVKTETNGTGGSVKIALGQTARYVRITGTKRATVYGYSIYEVEVHGESNTTPVKSEAATGAVREFRLEQNHPNPFNPSTHIRYALEERSRVKLEVMDVLGRRVAELVDADLASGAYEAVWHAEGLASGVYFCRIEAASREHPGTMFVTTRRMLLMR